MSDADAEPGAPGRAAETDVAIRPLEAGDVAAYRALMLEAYADPPPGVAPAFTSRPEERAALPDAWWRERIAGALGRGFGAFRGGALAGAVALAFESRARTAHKALLVGMYVQPALRGRGVGARLLQAALAHARARGVAAVRLGVIEGNEAALALYRRMGFELFGSEPMAVSDGDRYRATLHLWRRLDRG